jgi:hypothetical protein
MKTFIPLMLAASVALLAAPPARADAVTDWNTRVVDLINDAKMGTPPAHRLMAVTQTAVLEAVDTVVRRHPGASIDAAVAAAARGVVGKALPAQQAALDKAYETALAAVADGPGKATGIQVGERAAAAVLAARRDDGAAAADSYRPQTAAGAYVPTVVPAAAQWPQRKPWLLASPAQFRPAAPPALGSELWARDFNEIKAMGAKQSTRRSPEQTEIAAFWEATLPSIYHGVLRSVGTAPGRDVVRNARLYAVATQAMDDALIAVFDAKYHYRFWRPLTAIRNGELDGNDRTEHDAVWQPLIDAPMHPEYPCAHCILASTLGTVLKADLGKDPVPPLSTASPAAKGAVRRFAGLDQFVQEVAEARVLQGVHYRNSTEVGVGMGRRIGALAAERLLQPAVSE